MDSEGLLGMMYLLVQVVMYLLVLGMMYLMVQVVMYLQVLGGGE